MATIEKKDSTILGSKLAIYRSAEQKIGSKLILIKDAFNKLPCTFKGYDTRLGIIKEISNRIKTDESIKGKLKKHKKTYTYENAVEVCKDIVGFRIICMYEKDVFRIVNLIKKSGLKVVREKDYINNPKDSGYKSFHLTIEVPMDLPDGTVENVFVEIQVRTDFMDLWASREHEMKYKSKISKEATKKISQSLLALSGAIQLSQEAMENARREQLRIIEKADMRGIKGERYKEQYDATVLAAAERYVGSELFLVKSSFEMLPISSIEENARLGDIKDLFNRDDINRNIDSKVLSEEYNSESVLKTKKDNVGYRIICMYEQDLFTIVNLIKKSGLKIVREKDYVTNPKDSGYRSYHITVEVPVELHDGSIENVKVKIQIRTDFMDLWASREYEMKYNSELSDNELFTTKQALINLSGAIQLSQQAMENARKQQLAIMECKQNIEEDIKVLKKA